MFRLGVVGLGLGRQHAASILGYPAEWHLSAVCDALDERRRRFADEHPAVQGFAAYARFLADAPLDGVVLAVPHDLHAPMTIQALEAGKPVLIEKPMARTVEECRAMNTAARRAGRILMVAQNWRYTPWVRVVKQVVDRGGLGPLRAVRTEWLQRAVGDTRPGNWLLDGQRAGGGPFISLMVHNLDCLRYLLGEPARVYASCHVGHPAFANEAEDWGMAQVEFASGVIGQAFTSYAAFSPVDAGPLWLYGEEGTVYVRDIAATAGVQISTVARGPAYHHLSIDGNAGLPTENPSVNELLHFVGCAQHGKEPLSGGHDNIRTINFIEAIYQSARTGQPVSVAAVEG